MSRLLISVFMISQMVVGSSSFAWADIGSVQDDSALVEAVNSGRGVDYIEAANLVATQILPDDTDGSAHQKWKGRLSNGIEIMVVFNIDDYDRVPIRKGDRFSVGGQFIQEGKRRVIHWLHEDPRHRRPDGYVYLNGNIYGRD